MPSIIVYSLSVFLVLFIVLDVVPLIKKREWRPLIVPVLVFSLTLLYGLDFAWNLNMLPNPNQTLYYFQPVSDRFDSLLQVEF